MTAYAIPTRISGRRLTDTSPTFLPAGTTLTMLRDNLLMRPIDSITSDVLDTSQWSGTPTRGIVISIGPGRYPNIHQRGRRDGKDFRTVRPSPRYRPTEVRPGDIIEIGGREIGGYLMQTIFIGNELHVICSEQDVCYVEDDPAAIRRRA